MQKTIVRPIPNPARATAPVQPVDAPAPLPPPGYFARVALAVGVCALAALGALAMLLLRAGLPVHPLDMFLAVITLSALSGGLAGAYWTIRMVERPIRQEDALLRQEFEKAQAEIAEMTARLAKPPDVSGYQTHLALHELAFRHLTGQDTTKRKSGVESKLHAKALLIARAIGLYDGTGKGAGWTTTDPAVVLDKLTLISEVTPERAWITNAGGQVSVSLAPAGGE